MIQACAVFLGILLVTLPAMAQIYDHRDRAITKPLDEAIEQSNTLYANTASAGDADAQKSQAARYKEMTQAVNEANERHFNANLNDRK